MKNIMHWFGSLVNSTYHPINLKPIDYCLKTSSWVHKTTFLDFLSPLEIICIIRIIRVTLSSLLDENQL